MATAMLERFQPLRKQWLENGTPDIGIGTPRVGTAPRFDARWDYSAIGGGKFGSRQQLRSPGEILGLTGGRGAWFGRPGRREAGRPTAFERICPTFGGILVARIACYPGGGAAPDALIQWVRPDSAVGPRILLA